MARQWCADLPAEWVKVAFQRKVVGQVGRKSSRAWIGYLGAILAAWQAKGECEYLPGSSFANPAGAAAKAAEPEYWRSATPQPPGAYLTGPESKRRGAVMRETGMVGVDMLVACPIHRDEATKTEWCDYSLDAAGRAERLARFRASGLGWREFNARHPIGGKGVGDAAARAS